MNLTLSGGTRMGTITIPCSKSQAHRMLICAALSDVPSCLCLNATNDDIAATVRCLRALGAAIDAQDGALHIRPLSGAAAHTAQLDVGESGSTLRFLLPVLGALGVHAEVRMHGRLPERPLSPLQELLQAHGMTLRRCGDVLHVSGQLTAGDYTLPGSVSSQFVSGLLFALPLLFGDSTLTVTGELQSARYVAMTEQAIRAAGITVQKTGQSYQIEGQQFYHAPAVQTVEGDWSNAAFFLCMGALSKAGITVHGLAQDSLQADRAILALLTRFGAEVRVDGTSVTVRRRALRGITVDAGPIPDLIPTVSALAALAEGETHIENAARLRLKESDRLATTAALIRALGGQVREGPDALTITGVPMLQGGTVDAAGDHRIAMSAAVAACGCAGPVIVTGSECVAKSYPTFWDDFSSLKEDAL